LILIFYAFAREIAPFKRRLKNSSAVDHRELRGFRARVGEKEIVAIATGVGLARARLAAKTAFETFPNAQLAIGTGVAGALAEHLKPGDLILAECVIVHRSATAPPDDLDAIQEERVSEIAQTLTAAGVSYSSGAILTSHSALPDGVEKRRAGEVTGALAVDMETAAIAEEANQCGIPFVCLRAIIDEVDDLVIEPKLDAEGNIRPLATAANALRNPGKLLELPQMMRKLGLATRAIADALEVLVSSGVSRQPGEFN
jgi:adenosylhomocysteine nucleosidase